MKYFPLDATLYKNNRKKIATQLKNRSIAILNSNDQMPTSADGTMSFVQNASLFYLSGIDQEESILILAPDFSNKEFREILFLRETNENIAVWEGHKYTKAEAQASSGVSTVLWLDQLESTLQMLLAESNYIYLETNEHIRNQSQVETRSDRFIKWCKTTYPLHKYERLAPTLNQARSIKEAEEIKQIQHACNITEIGFRKVLELCQPGTWEYELEAEFSFEFLRNRATGFAYAPIIASGVNSCVLHYIGNNQQCQDGDIILFDVGASYANYNADMSRVIPVNGRFTPRQRAVYNAVLRVKNEATALLKPGVLLPDYQEAVGQIMEKELLFLGLISKYDIDKQTKESPAYKKYFMHGTSHHLGLNVHDVGRIHDPIASGMVFTVEPGIYIPAENIGIRLEDNIVITDNGHINLMQNIPIHTDEIESLMNK